MNREIIEQTLMDNNEQLSMTNNQFDTLMGAIKMIDSKAGNLATKVEGVATKVEGLATGVEGLTTGVEGLTTGVEGLTTKVECLTTKVEGLTTRVGNLEVRLTAFEENVNIRFEHVNDKFEGMNNRMGDLTVITSAAITAMNESSIHMDTKINRNLYILVAVCTVIALPIIREIMIKLI